MGVIKKNRNQGGEWCHVLVWKEKGSGEERKNEVTRRKEKKKMKKIKKKANIEWKIYIVASCIYSKASIVYKNK